MKNRAGKVTVDISIDDGSSEDMRIAELLEKHGFTGTFYIPSHWQEYNRIKGWTPLTKEQVLELSKTHEIGSHGVSHALLTQIPYNTAKYEIEASKTQLEDFLGKPVTKFCYPRGYASDSLRDVVRKHYSFARSTLVGNLDLQDDPVWQHTTVHVGCQRAEYGYLDWYRFAIKMIGLTKRRKHSHFRPWMHSWELTKNNAWNGLDNLLAQLKELV